MSESDQIKAENLKETLRQFQSYMVWGIGSSLSFFILTSTYSGSTTVEVPLPGAFVSVTTDFAKAIALAIFWIAGAMASYSYERAHRIVQSLGSNPELVLAILTFPSIATEIYTPVRVAAAMIPAGLVLVGLISEWGEAGQQVICAGVFLFVPYLALVVELTWLKLDK